MLSEKKLQKQLNHRDEFESLKMSQIERMTTETRQQDGVLTASDLELLFFTTSAMIRSLLELYQEEQGNILPKAGTVFDMSTTLTQKKIVIEKSLKEMNTQEIASRVYHAPEAADSYL